MRYIAGGLMGLAFLLSVVATAQAEPVAIVNAGFEASGLSDGQKTPSIPGWTIDSGNFGAVTLNPVPTQSTDEAPEGDHVTSSTGASISQQLSSVLTVNTKYTLMAFLSWDCQAWP